MTIKINRGELLAHFKASKTSSRTVRSPSPSRERGLGGQDLAALAGRWAGELGQGVFVTLAEEGIIAATAQGVWRVPAVPVKPPIDVVGAGDSVSANIALALGAGASPVEAAEIGSLAGSIVIKKLGTTGTASVAELAVAAARVAQSKE